MKIEVWTWGTGGPFGRELGIIPERRRRGHTATSIVVSDGRDGGATVHYMIDAGAPAVETMIERGISSPQILFITHPHFDHISDLDRLANSRMRGLMLRGGVRDLEEAKAIFGPLVVVGADECINHPADGVRARFGYLEGLVSWKSISAYDKWHSVHQDGPRGRKEGSIEIRRAGHERSGSNAEMTADMIREEERAAPSTGPESAIRTERHLPLEFKLLPVRHSKHAPGSSTFVFRFRRSGGGQRVPEDGGGRLRPRNVVIFGDFKSMEGWVADSPDLIDPACLILDSNTIRACGKYHASFEENRSLIDRWTTGGEEVLVLLNHISGFGDYLEGFYDGVPDDRDWQEAVDGYAPKPGVAIKIAEDGSCHRII
ncbi:MAG: Beta-lactamase domain protein [Methanothrix sp.]|nr:MAG: Beta-lactamase domain protein [Methanothrix sp.]